MSPVFAARRRAEDFDALVEAAASSRPVEDPRFAELLEVVSALRAAPAPEPRPAFVSSLRERLMTAAETEFVPVAADPSRARLTVTSSRRSPRERRIAAYVGSLAIVGASAGMAAASQSALPGDVLYPLKRAIENVHTSLTGDEAARGSVLLASATDRLTEVQDLSNVDSPDATRIAQTLEEFTTQTTQGSELIIGGFTQSDSTSQEPSISALRDWTAASMSTLNDVAPSLPASAQSALVDAANLLAEIDLTTQSLCPTCTGDSIDQMPKFLAGAAEKVASSMPLGASASSSASPDALDPVLQPDGSPSASTLDPVVEPPGSDDSSSAGTDPTASDPTSTPDGTDLLGDLQDVFPSDSTTSGGGLGNLLGGGTTSGGTKSGGTKSGGTKSGGTKSGGTKSGGGSTSGSDPLGDLVDGLSDPLTP
ncbi:DUF5667 domain-containing protein [Nocardioides acrostichi]|uniref:DUF5667 domain-containing protein n=1 Tax=Nocardioides acrostichi TaxID=2784339 RepID=A0A930V503_9ACTN|nr:DUF5667 domain-containing protein [Nocardioides acrostichi]MBF4163860.1 hypothetical protein [Nocardioides acrostichi]